MSSKFDHIPDFITPSEQRALQDWFAENECGGQLRQGYTRNKRGLESRMDNRLTTRLNTSGKVIFPKEAYQIFNRIREHYGFQKNAVQGKPCNDGMIATLTKDGGYTYEHTDGRDTGEMPVVTFNVVVQAPKEGSVLYLEDEPMPTKERALHCYAASEIRHRVSKCVGDRDRYLWIFRLRVPLRDWQ